MCKQVTSAICVQKLALTPAGAKCLLQVLGPRTRQKSACLPCSLGKPFSRNCPKTLWVTCLPFADVQSLPMRRSLCFWGVIGWGSGL